MKKTLLASAIALMGATSAQADTDWNGAYAGAFAGYAMGEAFAVAPPPSFDVEGYQGGLFAGYNYDMGSMVAGVEVAFAPLGDIHLVTVPGQRQTNTLDLKARLGYEIGDALAFVSGGYTRATWDNAGVTNPMQGFNVGAGVDYGIGDSAFVGAEAVYRDVTALSGAAATFQTFAVQLRGGLRF